MRILITGACGCLGRAVRRAAAAQHQLVLMDVVEQVEREGGIRASVTDEQAVRRAVEGCDAIIHTAALHGGHRHTHTKPQYIATNVIGAEHLFDAAIKSGVRRVVMASTMEVLLGQSWDAYGTSMLDESLPPRPNWIYPVTKLQVEILGHHYAQNHGLEVAQLRYVAFDDTPMHKLGLSLICRYISSDDAGQATLLAATRPGLRDEVLCISNDSPLRQQDTNDALRDPKAVLERHWPGSTALLQKHGLAPDPAHFWPITRNDNAKLKLGWQPRDTFEAFLRHLGWQRPS
ncbi:NAD-dependent epimerase/dehydratase family protein [Fontivita pretiosa]|uniref:NAD-dependent epimerase/dehydratase family protein n=1 Tax=Fontivita pretiosa TaxID=2989684 RepID=UPI003D17644B